MITPGWAVGIGGDNYDLECLKVLLAPSGDPWVEEDPKEQGKSLLLRSLAWTNLSEPSAVHFVAEQLVELVNRGLPLTTMDAQRFQSAAFFCTG